MSNVIKCFQLNEGSFACKLIYLLLLITLLYFIPGPAQDKNYWINAPPGATKIYTISFIDELNGKAVSGEGDVLCTSGRHKLEFRNKQPGDNR